jgi:CubicO group peptidase (beta-lactamase class C family)
MPTRGDEALADLLAGAFADLAAPGRRLPGQPALASVAVVGDDSGFWMSGAEASSAFHVGSVTKTMTALLLAVMSVQRRLQPTDTLDRYLGAASGSAARLVDLATHTAGYPRLPSRSA